MKELFQQHTQTIQFLWLTALFSLPLIFGIYLPLFPTKILDTILSFEVGVLIFGFFLTGFVFIPIAIADSVWVRRICLLVACLFAIPFTSDYRNEYGYLGMLGFGLLLFANYSTVFIASIDFEERNKLTVEVGLRCIVYIVVFSLVSLLYDMGASVSHWRGTKTLLFGSTYFAVLALIDSQRYFQKFINVLFHFLNNTWVRAPKSKIRYRKGKIRAFVLARNNMQQGPLFLFTGIACSLISGSVLYGSFNLESGIGFVLAWLFCAPFLVLGVLFVLAGLSHPYLAWRKGPSLLKLQSMALWQDNRLNATGFIPNYSKREKRTGFCIHLVQYEVSPIVGEEFIVDVKEVFNERLTEKHLQFLTSDRGTDFRLEYPLPVMATQMADTDISHVWRLEVALHEEVKIKDEVRNNYSWKVVFPLPS